MYFSNSLNIYCHSILVKCICFEASKCDMWRRTSDLKIRNTYLKPFRPRDPNNARNEIREGGER